MVSDLTLIQRENDHVKFEAEIGMLWLQAKEHQGLPTQEARRGKERCLPSGF